MARVAVVTGGTRGIGEAISKALKAEGYSVAANYAGNDEAANKFKAETGIPVYKWSVADYEACATGIKQVEADLGPVDILVNNAGITRDAMFHRMAPAQWREVIDTNLNGVFNMTQAFLAPLRAAKGRIVNIGSIQSFVHLRTPSSAAYTTSKHGVLGFTKALAVELGKEGVRVNAIGPGFIETNINANVRATNPALVQAFVDHTPLARTGKPEDIVGPAIFLASDMSAYVTGTIVMVDGGYRTV